MKVLVSAFSCGPGRGSEPGIGWNWAAQAARRHEVWLLTCDQFPEDIERSRPSNMHVVYVPSARRWSQLRRKIIPGLDWLYYYWWQWKAYRVARKLHAEVGFEVMHHATFGSWRVPSFLCLLPVPFVWGPIGGGETIPLKLRKELGRKGALLEAFRSVCQQVARWDPLVRLTMRRAAVILASNRDTVEVIPAAHRQKIRAVMACSGMSETEMAAAAPPQDRPAGLVVLYVALLEHRKGGSLAIKAFHRFARPHKDATLVIIGQGPEQPRLVALAQALGIAGQVRFLGRLPRTEVLGWMQITDILLFPSLRDSGGFVLLEAMTAEKPVICLDLAGPGQLLTEDCGIKVRADSAAQVTADLAAALERLAGDPQLRQAMGRAGRARVKEFDWNARGDRMSELYRLATGSPASSAGARALAAQP